MAAGRWAGSSKCAALLLICVAVVLLEVDASILTFPVESKARECFFEDVTAANSPLALEFEVVRGGLLDIKISILDPFNMVVFEKMAFFNKPDAVLNEQEGRIQIQASHVGTYSICFDNSMSRWTGKVVSFRMAGPGSAKREELVKFEHLTPMVDSVIKISDELTNIEQIQHRMRVREQSHRDASESTNFRVQWMSLFESALLISMSVFQVMYIRKWFSDTEKRGRI